MYSLANSQKLVTKQKMIIQIITKEKYFIFNFLVFKTICGEDIPPWVNRLAYLSTFVPFIERFIPKEWISPIAVQHTVESHINETKPTGNNSSNNTNSNGQTQTYSATSASTTTSTANKRADSDSVWSSIFSNLDRLE